ncbi:hypothetical protein ACFPMF_14745 [Larkinella bovis]|uniref:Uncharacterized protein n=1 Tax=Larkinella bovis TaxID=683041 RepID=A0ABW0IAP6_9BACT
MSKHPIDDLFARQLRDHAVKPQHASWEGLQRRMAANEQRQSPVVWWYAAAASVAVVLLGAWWLWSGGETDPVKAGTNPIAKHRPKKTAPQGEATPSEEPVLAYKEPEVSGQNRAIPTHRVVIKTAPKPVDDLPSVVEIPAAWVAPEDLRQPEEPVAAIAIAKQPERTLVVQVAMPEVKPTEWVATTETASDELTETGEEQPKKKRFRLGRVLRQFNKLRAGERIEWEEMGVQPGALMAKATEKVQEGKEKISDSYENLRYNTFRKNSNNK